MSAGPRIVFVRFLTPDSAKLMPWATHSSRVISAGGDPVPVERPTGNVVWQLVSANNRELARGADILDSFEGSRENAQAAVDAADSIEIAMVSEGGRGVYGWFGTIDGRPVVTCARWYNNDRDRRHSIKLAITALAGARLHDGARLTDPALMGGERSRVD